MRDYGQGVDILVATVSSDGAEVSGVEVLVPARMAYELIELEWSPDGARVAFSADGTVFTIDVGTGDLTQITSGLSAFDQRWSPDGWWIIVSSGGDLFRVASDGSMDVTQLTRDEAQDSNPDW